MRDGQILDLIKNALAPGAQRLQQTNKVVIDHDMRLLAIARILMRPRLRICGITLIGPLVSEDALNAEYVQVVREDMERRKARAKASEDANTAKARAEAVAAIDAKMAKQPEPAPLPQIPVGVNGGPKP